MRRLVASLRRDVVLQARNGLYAVSVLVVGAFAAALLLLPRQTAEVAAIWVPVFVVGNLIVTTFFFMAAAVLLERDEGTTVAIVTTPLRDHEYLGSKAATLAALGLLENGAIVLLFFGAPDAPAPFVGALLLLGVVYALLGFVSMAPYRTLNEWLMPSVIWIVALQAPLLGHLELLDRRLFLWHPVEPALVLLRASWGAETAATTLYGWIGAMVWVVIATALAQRQFVRWVVRQAGASA